MASHGPPTVAAIIVAAGSGSRLGADVPKAFVTVAGRTLLEHASSRFLEHPLVRDVVLAAPANLVESASAIVPRARVVAGGSTRQESVARALAALAADIDIVLVHDVARAFVPAEMITQVVGAVQAGSAAAIPTLPVTDTIRRCDPDTHELGETLDRTRLRAVQTPQGFRRAALLAAHSLDPDADACDDASLVEAMGVRVVAVRGDERAFKITVARDLAVAELIARDG
ncbi:MAG: 2-C-methyl-D-erythritol 4-phosphate cytidylyltransferase [Actinomycetota bacterium]|nr:2-C-methyl-D-erythritol 4-phosphate cytidylyltransferase [Actinomycetota bacterium]